MIGYISGKVIDSNINKLTVINNDIGYVINCTQPVLLDSQVSLWVEATYNDGEPTLWGFSNKEEKYLFLQLLKVNGIGPKTAFNLISRIGINNIIISIQNSNFALLKSGGVGEKLAQKLVIDLKDKLQITTAENSNANNIDMEQLKEALQSLGMSQKEIVAKLAGINLSEVTLVEEAIKLVLKK